MIFLNVIVLVLELLYYSLFLNFCRKDGKLYKYILIFIINTIITLILGNQNLVTYFLFILLGYINLKYVAKLKTSLYDMLIITIMLLSNLVVELPIYVLFYKLIGFNHFITTLLFELIKLLMVFILKFKLNKWYQKGKKIWDNNDFNIRYIFTILIYLYVIITIVLLIKLAWR